MGQTRAVVVRMNLRNPNQCVFLPVEDGQQVELAPDPGNGGTLFVGLGSAEAAQRGPWVAVMSATSTSKVITVQNTQEIWVYDATATDKLLVTVRDVPSQQKVPDQPSRGVISHARGYGGGGGGGGLA